jgi:hypothetical protein
MGGDTMGLRIEVVGRGPRADRMITQLRALTSFEIVPSRHDWPAHLPPEQTAASLRHEGTGNSFAILKRTTRRMRSKASPSSRYERERKTVTQ